MTPEKVLEVIKRYRNYFEELAIPKKKLSEEQFDEYLFIAIEKDEDAIFAHCHAMLDEMEIFVKENRMEKIFRWLGFVQGCLLCNGDFTLNEIKNYNRPNDKTTA